MKKYIITFLFIITLLLPTVNAEDFFKDGKNLYSDNVYMVNLETGTVVYELDSEKLVYPASLTKIMTCILAIENCASLDEVVTIPSGIFDDIYSQGGVHMSLKTGEEITVGDLICATMIRSTCDSASALACHISGSVEEFAKLMNKKAAEIGATNTHFVNAHGLHDDNHYTTAKDMYLIAEYALKNKSFCDIINQWSCTIPATNKSEEREFVTTIDIENPEKDNYYEYVTGVKSGFTNQAGRCLITKATKENESYLLVTLGANRDGYYENNMALADAVTLFEYYFAQYSIKNIFDEGVHFGEVEVKNSPSGALWVCLDSPVKALIAVDEEPDVKLNPKKKLSAPISKGDVVGSATITVGEQSFTRELLAMNDVKESNAKKTFSDLNNGNIFATVLDIASIVLLSLSAIIITLFVIKRVKKK